MRILGIDPGYAIMGYDIVDKKGNKFSSCEYGSILTTPEFATLWSCWTRGSFGLAFCTEPAHFNITLLGFYAEF